MGRVARLLLIAWICVASHGWAAQPVRVGAYPFLPFVDKTSGLTFDLVQALNAFQKDYRFEVVNTSANRRYRDLERGAFSMVMFENKIWGWDTANVDSSKVFLRGDGEVYVARSASGRGQEFFQTLSDKKILGVLGYHYSFANFESDPTVLASKFHITFSADNEVSLRNLLGGHGDVAVITKSYLSRYLLQNPSARDKLLVSDHMDQNYAHTIVVQKGSKPSAQDMDALLARMESAGLLKKLWAKYGIHTN
ncbi:MAG: amino acid ABC transporter substrate-binding protein [Curvibacter sp.]|nr:MAG: amino acid ABC transporter substrate-binding protein [Curvibacter sp.]